jgi:ABC-type oligopeptide transport system ATPase subunit
LLELHGVTRAFTLRSTRLLGRDRRVIKAVDDVSLQVPVGCSYGIAGESGSGKTTLARMVLLLDRPTAGSIVLEGRDLAMLDRAGVRWLRTRVQAVFQDATASLSPRMRVRDIIAEPLEAQVRGVTRRDVDRRVAELLEEVALPQRAARVFPGQLSGGQRQRVAIARALVVKPALIVLDEPVSALDVSIRAQVLNLLLDLRERHGLTYLFIAHDLALLSHVTDRLAVMQKGVVVEEGETESVLASPSHPYTRSLRDAVPGER